MALFLVAMIFSAKGQFFTSQFPLDNMMVPRNQNTNQGVVTFYFTSADTVQPANVQIKKFKDQVFVGTIYPVYVLANVQYEYNISDTISASLNSYRYELWYNNVLITKADNICSGDFFILDGQSNAESMPTLDSCYADYQPFIRTYGNGNELGSKKEWFVAKGDCNRMIDGCVGQLGVAIANEIILKHLIPVCILNGAVGGKPLNYFLPDSANHTNLLTSYGRLCTRVHEAHAQSAVRAIIWYQGENDASICNTQNDYLNSFHKLFLGWKSDYPNFENLYLVQIRAGCQTDRYCSNVIQEAQRQIANYDSTVEVISTTNISHSLDNCHYNYLNGYKLLGKKISKLISVNQHNQIDTTGFHSPEVKCCYTSFDNRLDLILKYPVMLHFDALAASDFYITQTHAEPVHLSVTSDTIHLIFNDPILPGQTISYSGHAGSVHPVIENQDGNGLLCFYNKPILPYCNVPYTNYTLVACDSLAINGQTYTSSGIYSQLYAGVYGCDSVVHLTITIYNTAANIQYHTACDSFSMNGQTYYTSGNYLKHYINTSGCDSNIILNLEVNHSSATFLNQTVCDSLNLNGQTYDSKGIYVQHLTSMTGCDSVLTIDLSVNHGTGYTYWDTACNFYLLNAHKYTGSGIYTQFLSNVAGCDSILTVNLFIHHSVNMQVSQDGANLYAPANMAAYQWLRCNPYELIGGENKQAFRAVRNGDYAVIIVNESGCNDTLEHVTVSNLPADERAESAIISIYPNPNNGKFTIDIGTLNKADFIMYNIFGQIIFQQTLEKKCTLWKLPVTAGHCFYKVYSYGIFVSGGQIVIED